MELNLDINQQELIEFCKKHDISVTGYSPLGHPGNRENIGNQFGNPNVEAIAKKYGKTPAQICLRFVVNFPISFNFFSLYFVFFPEIFPLHNNLFYMTLNS